MKFKPRIQKDILKVLKRYSDKFIKAYSGHNAEEKLNYGLKLFYRIFGLMVTPVADKRSSDTIKKLVSNADFISATFALSLEIVLVLYSTSEWTFPWILDALFLHSFMVWKVIESIIIHDRGLFCIIRCVNYKLGEGRDTSADRDSSGS